MKIIQPPGNLRTGKKWPALLLKKPLCMGYLSPACKMFIERPVTLYD